MHTHPEQLRQNTNTTDLFNVSALHKLNSLLWTAHKILIQVLPQPQIKQFQARYYCLSQPPEEGLLTYIIGLFME